MLGSATAQEVKRAKLGHSFTGSRPRALAMKQFASAVEKATGGKVAIDVYGSATLGSEDKMLIALQSGTQDLYMGALSPISAGNKEFQIFGVLQSPSKNQRAAPAVLRGVRCVR